MPAMSAGLPMRFIGALAAIESPKAESVAAIILDSNGPGAIAFTVILGARWRARWRVSWCTPALAVEYEYVSIIGTWMPSIEPTLMTRAGSPSVAAASSNGRRNRVRWYGPFTLMLSTRSHAASSWSASGAPQVAPALLISTWRRSSRDAISSASRRHSASVDRSAGIPMHSPTADRRSATSATTSAFRDETYTFTPART